MTALEQRVHRPTRTRGACFTLIGIAGSAGTAFAIERVLMYPVSTRHRGLVRLATTTTIATLCIAGRMLGNGRKPEAQGIRDAISWLRHVTWAAAGLLALAASVSALTGARTSRSS